MLPVDPKLLVAFPGSEPKREARMEAHHQGSETRTGTLPFITLLSLELSPRFRISQHCGHSLRQGLFCLCFFFLDVDHFKVFIEFVTILLLL